MTENTTLTTATPGAQSGAPQPSQSTPDKPVAAEKRTSTFLSIVELVAVGLSTLALSALLQRLSGSSLLMPPAWRQLLFVLFPLTGVAVYAFARHLTRLATSLIMSYRAAEDAHDEERKKRTSTIGRIFATLLGASGLIFATLIGFDIDTQARTAAFRFQPPYENWWWAHYGEIGVTPPTDLAERESFFQQHLEIMLPHFVDRQSNTVYLSLPLPDDVRQRIIDRGDGDFGEGLHDLRNEDPNTLIDWIEASQDSNEFYRDTRRWFFTRHFVMICVISASAGVLFVPAQTLVTEIVKTIF